jgi:archaellum component FlaC
VNKAIERIEASVSDRDNELRDMINEKSGIQKRNFEILGEKIDQLQKTIDRMQPPSIRR